jgi:hypothetical protein
VAEIHYRGSNQPIQEVGTLGIYWASGPSEQPPSDLVIDARPEGASTPAGQKFFASVPIGAEMNILAFKPDVSPGLSSVEVSARKPDGTRQILLLLRDILEQWPTPYILKDPVTLSRGTELTVTAYSAASQPPGSVKVTASAFSGAPPPAATTR